MNAQESDVYNYNTFDIPLLSNTTETGAVYNTFLSTNSINYKFANALKNNRYISNDLKKSNNIRTDNFIGNGTNYNVYLISKPGKMFNFSNVGYRIGINYSNFSNFSFTNDFYNLVFYGNKMFAGKAADLSKCKINQLKYYELQLGLFHNHKSKLSEFTFYYGISLIGGQSYNSFYIKRGYLYTSETGESIYLYSNIDYSRTQSHNIKDFNGFGISTSFYGVYKAIQKNILLSLAIDNIGAIRWKSNSVLMHTDTTIHFEGVGIDDILNFEPSGYNGLTKDSVIDIIDSKEHNTSFIRPLPLRINLCFTKMSFLNEKLNLSAGVCYYLNANQPLPLFYTRFEYAFNNKLAVNIQPSDGGYSNFMFGMGLSYNFRNNFFLRIASNNILGLITPKQSFSQNLFCSFAYRF